MGDTIGSVKYSENVVTNSGIHLDVLQELPSKGDIFPTVLLVPGFGVDLHEYGFFDDVVRSLNKNGYQTIRFSFSGTGKSQGKFLDMTVERQVREFNTVLGFVLKDRFTDKNRIGILAQSFGGVAVTMAFPLPHVVSLLFTSFPIDPARSIERYFRQKKGFHPDGISEIERSNKKMTRIGPAFWKSIRMVDIRQNLKKLSQPTLFIYGESDRLIDLRETEENFLSLPLRKKRLQMIQKAGHGFTRKSRPVAVSLIRDWFEETL